MRKSFKLWYREDYLSSEWWQWRRKVALNHAHAMCERCGSCECLHVHHKKEGYRHLYREPSHLLEVLCADCHYKEHHPIKTWDEIKKWLDK